MGRVSEAQINEAIANFDYEGKLLSKEPFGSGHINDTYLLKYEISEMGILKVILQRMNREIFTNPVELMENVVGVTTFLRKKIIENGGDPERETLNVIPAKDGKPYYVDSKGEYWRSYVYITDASSYDQVEKPEDFTKVQSHLDISSGCWLIILQRHSMRRSRDSMIQEQDSRYLKIPLQRMYADVQQKYRMRSTLYWHMKTWQMYLGSFRTKENFRFVSRTMIQS